MKKKRIWIIIAIVLFFLLVLIGMTILVSKEVENNQVEKRMINKNKEEQTITCIKENGHDGAEETEEVFLKKGILVTRTNKVVWVKPDPKEKTCEYYSLKSQGLNSRPGVTSNTTCDEHSGTSISTYIISEIDKEDIRLKQFDFVNADNVFDYTSWMLYMEKDGFDCIER